MKKLIHLFHDAPLSKFCCSVLILAMALVMTMNAILRRFFQFSFNWSDEIIRYMCIYMGFFGMVAGWRHGKHISITVITEHLVPEPLRKYFRLLADIASIVFMVLMTWYGIILTQRIARTGQSSAAMHLPMVFIYGIVPVCCILSLIQIVLQIVMDKSYLKSRE